MALNQLPYYLLPQKQQKMLELMLDRVQIGAKIKMGPFSVLNYEAATNVNGFLKNLLLFEIKFKIDFPAYQKDLFVRNDDAKSNAINKAFNCCQ